MDSKNHVGISRQIHLTKPLSSQYGSTSEDKGAWTLNVSHLRNPKKIAVSIAVASILKETEEAKLIITTTHLSIQFLH